MRTSKTIKQFAISAFVLMLIAASIFCFALMASAEGASNLTDPITGITLKDTDGDGSYEINSADDLFAFANLVNATDVDHTKIDAELIADIDLNPNYIFTFIPDTGLVAVKRNGSTIGYLGTGVSGTAGGNKYFDSEASIPGAVYKESNSNFTEETDSIFSTNKYKLKKWTPIGGFSLDEKGKITNVHAYQGTFDGAGHTISGIYVNSNGPAVGLFGYMTTPATIQNLTIANSYFKGAPDTQTTAYTQSFVASIVGANGMYKISDQSAVLGGTIQNCRTSAFVINNGSHTGSIAGYNSGTIKKCEFNELIKSNGWVPERNGLLSSSGDDAGGIAGRNDGTIEYCTNRAPIHGASSNVGGIVGYNQGEIDNCHNKATITGKNQVGGIAGAFVTADGLSAKIEYCSNTGKISGAEDCVGGIVGLSSVSIQSCNIQSCNNEATVEGSSKVGGIVGFLCDKVFLYNNHNKGDISGSTSTGGITGTCGGNIAFSCCSNFGNITGGNGSTGGIVGTVMPHTSVTISNCHNCEFDNTTGIEVWIGNSQTLQEATVNIDSNSDTEHHYNSDGFCKYCDAYEPAILITDANWNSYETQFTQTNNHNDYRGYYLIQKPGQLYWFSTQAKRTDNAVLLSNNHHGNIFHVNTGYNFSFAPDTGLIEVRNGKNELIAHIGTGIRGDKSGSNNKFDAEASFSGTIYGATLCNQSQSNYCTCRHDYAAKEEIDKIRRWEPSGYNGIFDGNGATIVGLFTVFGDDWYENAGLFASTGTNALVKDVKIGLSCFMSGLSFTGSIVAENRGTVENCANGGLVIGKQYVGGIVGVNYDAGVVRKCENASSVFCATDTADLFYGSGSSKGIVIGNTHVGGIVGFTGDPNSFYPMSGGLIENCKNRSVVIGAQYVGGIVGLNYGSTVSMCQNNHKVVGVSDVGGIAGKQENNNNPGKESSAKILNCKNTSPVVGSSNFGGIIGTSSNGGTIEYCENSASITLDSSVNSDTYTYDICCVGGIIGLSDNTTIKSCKNSGQIEITSNALYTTIEHIGGILGHGSYTSIQDSSNTGAILVNSSTQDWNFSSEGIGGVVGVIDGSIIGSFNTGDILAPKSTSVAGVAGRYNGFTFFDHELSSCYNKGNITAREKVGGIVGETLTATIQSCYNTGSIQGYKIGGIVGGGGNDTISNCYNAGNIIAKGSGVSYAGGIIGSVTNSGTISYCHNYGFISGNSWVGALTGNVGGTIQSSYYLEGCAQDDDNTFQNGRGNGTTGDVTPDTDGIFCKTAAEFLSGEISYLLQANQSEAVWGQILQSDGLAAGFDIYPVFRLPDGSNEVFASPCTTPKLYFTNHKDRVLHDSKLVSTDSFELKNGSIICSNCGALAIASVTAPDGTLTYYIELEQAIAAAIEAAKQQGNETVFTLLENITIDKDVEIDVEGKTFIFDLNGKNITNLNSATLRFVNGTVTMTDDSEALGKVSAQIVVDGGTLIIKDGEFLDVLVNSGSLTVEGGDFFDLDHVGGTLTITGGSYDKLYVGEQGTLTDVSAEGYYFYQSSQKVDFNLLQAPYTLTNVTVRLGVDDANAVAKVGDAFFADLKSAIAYANEINGGAVVTLLKDITLSETLTISNDITLKGRHVITRGTSGTLFAVTEDATFTLDGGIVIDGNNNWIFDKEGFFKDLEANLVDPIKGEYEKGKPKPGHADAIYGYSYSAEGGLVSSNSMFSVSAGGNIIMNQVTIQNVWGDNGKTGKTTNKATALIGTLHAGSELIMNDGCLIQHVRGSVIWDLEGTWTINGGKITDLHEHNENGGLTTIRKGGVLVINGGEICNITAYGADYNASGLLAQVMGGGLLVMNGGHIHDNATFTDFEIGVVDEKTVYYCAPGGLVYLNGGGAFEMNGGVIEKTQGNITTALACLHNGNKFHLNAGTIVIDEAPLGKHWFGYSARVQGEVIVGEGMIISGDSIGVRKCENGGCHLIVNGTVDCDLVFPDEGMVSFGKRGVVNGDVSLKANMTIEEGTWNGEVVVESGVTLTVTGGKFENLLVKEGATLTVTGGSFGNLTVEKGGTLVDCTESGYFFYRYGKVIDASHVYSPSETCTITDVSVKFGADLSDAEIKLEKEEYIYDSSVEAYTPALTVKIGCRLLKLDEDYTVAYSNNTTAGIATVTITAKGNVYTGTRVITFKIIEKSATVEEIENILQEITNIEEQIQTGQTSTNEILQQIENVIEKIETIENNTAVSEDVNKAIEDAKNAVTDSYEKALEEAVKKLETADQKNAENLQSALQSAMKDLKELIDAAEAYADTQDTALKTELTEKISEASESLLELIKKVQENLDDAKDALDKAIADGDKTLDEKITNLNKALEDAKAVAEASDEALKTELTEKIEKADDALAEAIKKVQENLDNAKEELDKAIADGDKALDEKITNLNKALEDAKAVAEASDEALKTELTEKIEKADDALAEAIKKVQENLDNAKEELDKAIADGDKALDEKITNLNEALEEAKNVAAASDELIRTELIARIEESNKVLTETIRIVENNLEIAKEELNKAITDGDAALEEKITNLDDAIKAAKAAAAAADEELRQDLTQKIDTAVGTLSDAVKTMRQDLDDAIALFKNLFTIAVILAMIAVFGNFVLMAWGIVGKSKK